MNHRNNRRSEATKNKIKQALVDMLHDQELNKITVQALCERASINRSTFYNHYESPLSVLQNIECDFAYGLEQHLESLLPGENTIGSLTELLTAILEYIQTNSHICFLLQTPSLQPFFRQNIFRNVLKNILTSHPAFTKPDDEYTTYTLAFILYGCGHVIDLWLRGDCCESPHEIACLLAGYITKN